MKTHGTPSCYNAGCRCDDCRKTNRERSRRQRAARNPADAPHGTAGGYTNYGCRCEPCRRAHAASISTRVRAYSRAMKRLRALYREEFDRLYAQELAAADV